MELNMNDSTMLAQSEWRSSESSACIENGITPKFVAPNLPSQCKWSLKKKLATIDPHLHRMTKEKPKIFDSILDCIGNTPLVRLDRIRKHFGLKCQLLAKCEYFNPGGSVKDRIGWRMVCDAERDGLIKPGYTIIEPTSGNTGIGLAMAAAVRGYKCIIVMPEKMSNEKVNVLKALGAKIIRTPTSARYDATNSHIYVAQKLQSQIKDSIILDQYRNASNPLAHYDETGLEILQQTDGKIDMIVMGAGTGGTVTGVGRRIKEVLPKCRIVAVDPIGSILAEPEHLNQTAVSFYEVEGIGYDFIPTVLDRSVIDEWIKVDDREALTLARMLIQMEGILCGGSSGSALAGALRAARFLSGEEQCVVILPDGVRNYMTKFLDDAWMLERNMSFKPLQAEPWFYARPIKELINGVIVTTIDQYSKCLNAIQIMQNGGFDQIPVVESVQNKKLLGMVTVNEIMAKLTAGSITLNCPVHKALTKKFQQIQAEESVGELIKLLSEQPYMVVVERDIERNEQLILAIVTHIDVLNYLTKCQNVEQF